MQLFTFFTTRLKGDDFARNTAMMVGFTLFANFINYLFQLVLGKLLTPSEYGTLISLTYLLLMISVFNSTLQTVVAKFTTRFQVEGMPGEVRGLWRLFLKRAFLLGLFLFLVSAILTPLLSRFLNIADSWALVILFSSLIFAFVPNVNLGVLQGMEKFLFFGLGLSGMALVKLAAATLLTYFGAGIYGGLASFLIANIAAFLLTLVFLKNVISGASKKFEASGLSSYAGFTFIAILAFSVMTNIDVVLAKHYLTPEVAGNYSVLAVSGRIVLYGSMGVAAAMFPKTSAYFESQAEHRRILKKAILYVLLISGGALTIFLLFPQFIVGFLFSDKYLSITPYLFKYGAAMAFFSLTFTLINYLLSINAGRFSYPMSGIVLLQIISIALFHSGIDQITNVMLLSAIASSICAFIFVPGYVGRRFKKMPTRQN